MRKLLNSVAVVGALFLSSVSVSSQDASGALLSSFNQVSEVHIPLTVDLATIEREMNDQVPTRLATIHENNMKCVEAEWLVTKVPEFRGLKIYSKMLKTKISPDIYCDVNGHVDRSGAIKLSGSGSQLRFALPMHASVTAKAGVQETAKADATIFADVIPGISRDWVPTLDLQTSFHWNKRPTLMLFDLIKITIGSKVEPKLKDELAALEADLPRMMENLDLRSEVEAVWRQVQEPILIAENPTVYATFKPTGVGFSDLNIVRDDLEAQIFVRGETHVVIGEEPEVEPVPLLPLEKIKQSDGRFALAVPAVIEGNALQKTMESHLNEPIVIDIDEGAIAGQFTAENVKVSLDSTQGLTVTADVAFDNRAGWLKKIDLFNWFDFSGTVSLSVVPEIEPGTNRIFAKSAKATSDTSSDLADTLVQVLDLPIVRDRFAKLVAYDYSSDLNVAIGSANEAIADGLVPGVAIDGAIETAGAQDLVIKDDALVVVAKAAGSVSVKIGELSN